ncbi:MAG: hypothetical protein Kow0031_17010 [Anaerolineae bacterium]
MNVNVRLSAGLAHSLGNPRLSVTLPDDATVADLLAYLRREHPQLQPRLETVIPMIAGRHASPTQNLSAGQEVALLLPAAGG